MAFTGGGGKTTAMYYLARKLCAEGHRVIVTTTTHMQYPLKKWGPLCTSAAAAAIRLDRAEGAVAVCGIDAGMTDGIRKITGMPAGELDRCRTLCSYMLVEADGAKMKPLKAPQKGEPVIPSGTDVIVVCGGLDAVGKNLADVCFRQDIVVSILRRSGRRVPDGIHIITCADTAEILYRGYVFPFLTDPALSGTKLYVLLNKADDEGRLADGKSVLTAMKILIDGDAVCARGAVLCGFYITSFLNGGSFFYEQYTYSR